MASNEVVIVHTTVPGLVIKLTKPEDQIHFRSELSFLCDGKEIFGLDLNVYAHGQSAEVLWRVFNGFHRSADGKSWVDPYKQGKELEAE